MSPGFSRRARLIVALDASTATMPTLSVASALADRLAREIHAIFVEDPNLLRSAQLPVTSRIVRPTARVQPYEGARVESEWRTLAVRARKVLAREASHRQLRWAFRVSRGSHGATLARDVGEGDVVLLCWGSAPPPRIRLAPTRAVAVLVSDHAASASALEVALDLAGPEQDLLALVESDATERVPELRAEVGAGRARRAQFVRLRDATAGAVHDALRAHPADALVLPRDHPLARTLSAGREPERLPCTVLLA